MARAPKCPICHDDVDKEQANQFIYSKQKYYHASCFDEMKQSQIKVRQAKKVEDKRISKENDDFDLYVDYFFHLTQTEQPKQFIEKQLKKLVKDGFRLEGLKMTATYYTEVLKKPFNKKAGINILAYHYKKAENFYTIQAKNMSAELPELVDEVVYITVEESRQTIRNRNRIKLEDVGGV